jgi:hypothetical protein
MWLLPRTGFRPYSDRSVSQFLACWLAVPDYRDLRIRYPHIKQFPALHSYDDVDEAEGFAVSGVVVFARDFLERETWFSHVDHTPGVPAQLIS